MNDYWGKFEILRGQKRAFGLMRIVGERGYIGGSYAAFMVSPMAVPIKPNDIDIFAKSPDCAHGISQDLQLNHGYWLHQANGVAWSLRKPGAMDVQVVIPNPKWEKFPDDILNDFDLDICRAIVIDRKYCLADYKAGMGTGKVLRVNDPLRTLKRIVKYKARGIEFNDHEILKVFQAWEQVSPERKQATLDQALKELKSSDPDSGDWEYDSDDWFEGE